MLKRTLNLFAILLIVQLLLLPFGHALATSNNLVPNPSVETASPSNPSLPQSWSTGRWGTNTTQFSYLNSGYDGSHSLSIQMSAYTNGDAKWYFAPVAVTAGSNYTYSDYYTSSVKTEVDAVFTNASGATTYKYLGTASASPSSWQQYSSTFTIPAGIQSMTVYHLIYSVGSVQTDNYSLTPSSIPTVSIVSPLSSSVQTGSVSVSANASDLSGISSVQFMLDGQTLGAPVTASPYQINWDTTLVPNGSHNLTAVATNTNGQSTTSASVPVTVINSSDPTNLFQNASLETSDPNNSNSPAGWHYGAWGTNTNAGTYLTTGHNGNRSVKAEITQFTSGAAYWYNQSQPIVGGQMYDYSDYFESSVLTQVEAGVKMNDGTTKYIYLGQQSPSPTSWTKYETQFTAPVGAVSINFYHQLYSAGWLATDDYSLSSFNYQGFNRPLITITADDGYSSFYNNGLPILQKYGLKSTDYIITGDLGSNPGYMTTTMVKKLNNSGQEIASHTVTHPDLTTLTSAQVTSELANAQTFLQNLIGQPVIDFASPFGTYNGLTQSIASNYYQTYRGTQTGYNVRNNFNSYNLLVQNVRSDTTLAQVQSWIDQAKSINAWLIIVYHEVNPSTATGLYNTYPSDFDAQMSAIKNSNITVETVSQAIQEVKPQL